jgi:hypothetical protein
MGAALARGGSIVFDLGRTRSLARARKDSGPGGVGSRNAGSFTASRPLAFSRRLLESFDTDASA